MQRYELDAWLGDDHGLTDDQITGLLTAAHEIGQRYPDPDDADERDTALTVAYRLTVEDQAAVVAELSDTLMSLRRSEVRTLAALRQCAVTLVVDHGKGGRGITSEGGFASATGLDRMTVRGWRGKR